MPRIYMGIHHLLLNNYLLCVCSIWDHLVNITKDGRGTTVIITTHYIDETRQAGLVS